MDSLELFAGIQSFSKVAKERGHNVFTSDIRDLDGIDYVCDILDFEVSRVPFIPQIIWASPDCATWSVAAGNLHFNSKSLIPKTDKAKKAFIHIDKTLDIIFYFLKKNKNLKYYIENPVGKLNWYIQAGSLFSKIPRVVKLTQSSYGRRFKKPTHIFTNDLLFKPRPLDKRILGTNLKCFRDGKRGYYDRAMLPAELCKEIIISSEKQFNT